MVTKARVEITAKDRTKEAFGSAQRSMDRFKRTVISLGAVLSVGLFARATKNALDFADSIDKAAKVAGVTTTFLQEMRFAGDQLGISTKLVDEGFRRFGRRLGEFVNSGGGPAQKAIEALGISVRDMEGNFRGTEAVFDDFVRQFERLPTFLEQSAFAAQAFGDDAGPKLALLLAQGTAGISKLKNEAQDIGAVLSEDVIDNAVEAKDALAKLSGVLKVQFTEALVSLTPVITSAAESLIGLSKSVALVFGNVDTLSADLLIKKLDDLSGSRDRAIEDLKEAEQRESGNSFLDTFDSLIKRSSASIKSELVTLERQIDETEVALGARNIASLNKLESRPSLPPPASTPKIDTAALESQAKRAQVLFKSTRTDAEELNTTVTELNDLLAAGAIDFDTYSRAVFNAQDAFDSAGESAAGLEESVAELEEKTKDIQPAARDLGFTFSSAFEDAVIGGKGLRDVLDGILEDIARITLRRAITEPLAAGITARINPAIPAFASGTTYAPGGISLVGEKGPELVNLPKGSQVYPNDTLGGTTVVNVINNTQEQATVQRSNDNNGRELINIIIGTFSRDIASNGSIAQTMQSAYGLRRSGVVRS